VDSRHGRQEGRRHEGPVEARGPIRHGHQAQLLAHDQHRHHTGQGTYTWRCALACHLTMARQYELAIEVPFPGLTNNLTWRIPIHVNSGVGHFDPNVPPPALDLPP
jgi:hypothetical protein